MPYYKMNVEDYDKIMKMAKMMKLQQKLHQKGKLSKKEHESLKQLHAEHGAGLFDSVKEFVGKLIVGNHPIFKFLSRSGQEARQRLG